jgi:hypothetical protein
VSELVIGPAFSDVVSRKRWEAAVAAEKKRREAAVAAEKSIRSRSRIRAARGLKECLKTRLRATGFGPRSLVGAWPIGSVPDGLNETRPQVQSAPDSN